MRKSLLVLLVLFTGSLSFAQNTANSPYSSYGIGSTNGLDHATFLGIGNSRITMVDSTVLNFYNPASYNSLAKGQPIFSLGAASRLSTFSEGDTKEFTPYASIQHFALGFSFEKYFGMAFGLKPYARRGYDFSTGGFIDSDSMTYTYQGTGSINEAFIGISADLLSPFKFDSTQLSIGANAGYLFGSVANTRKASLYSSSGNDGGVGVKTVDIRSFHYDLGLYFTHNFNKNHSVGLYATMDPLQKLNASYEEAIFYAGHVDDPNSYDTAAYVLREDSILTNTPKFTYGLSYKYRFTDTDAKARTLHPEVALHVSYSTSDWSKYENTFSTDSSSFLNTSKLSVGVQFVPEYEFQLNTATTNIFSRIRYRAGFYQYTLPFTTNGEQVSDFGTTFGFGIPVAVQKSLSSINFGFSVGRRGVSDQTQLNENYYGISFGLSIAPGQAEKWFRKRKLN